MHTLLTLLYKYKIILALFGVLCIGILVGMLTMRIAFKEQDNMLSAIIHSTSEGRYTNPILDCELFQNDEYSSFKKLEYKINQAIKQQKDKGNAELISVYFRDMNTGAWVGINEKQPFSPASLLKVPIMMAYFKLSEKDPSILTRELTFIQENYADLGITQNILPTHSLQTNNKYTVNDLLSRMIINSDNYAQFLLMDNLKISELDSVYLDLGINIPGVRNTEDFMSVKEYASFFRILYNSTYLTRERSEEALSLLSQVEYNRALKAGIPPTIEVAHKFGERSYPQEDGREIRQLHDCGIIYYPEKPYLLCVMTRGEDFESLSITIKDISHVVYQEVSSRNSPK